MQTRRLTRTLRRAICRDPAARLIDTTAGSSCGVMPTAMARENSSASRIGRALPMTRSAVLAGRTTADALRNLFVLTLMTGVGYAIGFRFHAGPAAALAAIGLALAVGVALSWIFSLLGLLVRDSESAGIGGLLAVIPLIFTSSTFVPVATFPGWLQAFAKVNPITVTVDAIRALSQGGPTANHVWHALGWIGGLLAITVPTAVIRYRRTTAA